MYDIVKFSSLDSSDKEFFFKDIKKLSRKDLAVENMWHEDWANKKNTLPYILLKKNRFSAPNGEFHIVYFNKKFIACGGIYISEFNKEIALAGVRTWVENNFRNKSIIGDYILPAHKAWAIEKNMKAIALSFNDYNKNIINIFKRNRLGEANGRISNRTEHNLFYYNFNELSFPVTIQYTKQWVIYEKLDSNWDFNWTEIAYQESMDPST